MRQESCSLVCTLLGTDDRPVCPKDYCGHAGDVPPCETVTHSKRQRTITHRFFLGSPSVSWLWSVLPENKRVATVVIQSNGKVRADGVNRFACAEAIDAVVRRADIYAHEQFTGARRTFEVASLLVSKQVFWSSLPCQINFYNWAKAGSLFLYGSNRCGVDWRLCYDALVDTKCASTTYTDPDDSSLTSIRVDLGVSGRISWTCDTRCDPWADKAQCGSTFSATTVAKASQALWDALTHPSHAQRGAPLCATAGTCVKRSVSSTSPNASKRRREL